MMLNSISNYKRLILALVCGSISYSTFAKVYSWRDADGAMHYSQFPRQIVEKNAAQSRASRKQADMNDVVNDLSPAKVDNLLDGLDDIVANASVERQVEKVLSRRDPHLVLIEQQLARQQAQQQARLLAQQTALKEQQALITAAKLAKNNQKTQQTLVKNSFMADIQKRVNGHANRIDNKASRVARSTPSVQPAAIQRQPIPGQAIQGQGIQRQVIQLASIQPAPEQNVITKVEVKQSRKATNQFLAGINKKLNRKTSTQVIDEPQRLANNNISSQHFDNKYLNSQSVVVENKPIVASPVTADSKLQAMPEQVQNQFLADINKKLFRAHLPKADGTTNSTATAALVNTSDKAKGRSNAALKNKALLQSADEIKAIEKEISSSNKVKTPSVKQVPSVKVNSALMLSRLSYNHNARLPLLGAGTNQLDRQGIDASSQFVNEVNRHAE